MTDQELVLSAVRQVGLIIAEHLELGMTDADEAIAQLVAVLDTKELADAINRLERGYSGDLLETQDDAHCLSGAKQKEDKQKYRTDY